MPKDHGGDRLDPILPVDRGQVIARELRPGLEVVDGPVSPRLEVVDGPVGPHREIVEDQRRTLITAGALAPTSFNMQNRHFVCVVDPEVKSRISAAAWGQEQVRDASVVFVLTGNRNAYGNTARYLRNAPPATREVFESKIPDSYAENNALARDEDC